MASRQVAAKAVNWAALAARIPKDPKASAGFDEIRIKFETTKGVLNSTPETPAPIDWDHYMAVVKNKALVEKFHAAYSSLEVPYPDTTEALAALQADRASQADADGATKKELENTVLQAQAYIDKIQGIKAYEIMKMDEYYELNPDIGAAEKAHKAEGEANRLPILGPGFDPQPLPGDLPELIKIPQKMMGYVKKLLPGGKN
jgi:F-type H+-transporting ATPase subunit d